MDKLFDTRYFFSFFTYLVEYLPVTLGIALATMLAACLLGLLVMVLRFNKVPVLSQLASLYVLLCRALPSMILIYIVFFGIPVLLMSAMGGDGANEYLSRISPAVFAVVGLTLHTGAYLAEIFRGAIESVDKSQTEAALACGMTWAQAFFRVILPQAAVYAVPLMANQFLNLLKGTSIAFMISVTELFGAATVLAASTNAYLEIYIVAALIYWMTSIIFERIFQKMEYSLSYYKRGKAI